MPASPPTERSWLPLTGIFLSLVALLIVPAMGERLMRDLESEMLEVLLPAAGQVTELRLALAEETMLRATYDRPAAVPTSELERAVDRRERALASLSRHAARIQGAVPQRVEGLTAAVRRWEMVDDEVRRQAEYEAVAARLEAIETQLASLVEARRGRIADLARTESISMLVLAFLALASAMVVARLHHRLRGAALETTRALRQQRVLLESSGEGVFGIDAQGVCTFVNPSASAMLGYEIEEMVGADLHALIHHTRADGRPHPHTECPSWKALRLGVTSDSGDELLWRKDGTPIHAEFTASPIVEHGEIRGAVVTIRDVTRRLQDERERSELFASEQRARTHAEMAEQRARFLSDASEIFSSSLDVEKTLESLSRLVVPRIADSCVIYLVDAKGEIQRLRPTHADPAREKILIEQFEKYPPKLESLIPPVRRALKHGRPSLLRRVSGDDLKSRPGDASHKSIVGTIGLQTLVVAPLRARGRILGAISFARSEPHYGPRDLTLAEELASRAALAIDNARLYQESRAAAAARNELIAIVSHDLRNPLNVVRMGTQSLLRHWPPTTDGEPERRQLTVMQKAAERMDRLVRDLLDLAQIDAGRLTIDAGWLEPAQLLGDAVELIQPLASEKGIRLRCDVPRELPRLWGDAERLLQVLSNLAGNAVKFAPDESIVRLAASAEPSRIVFSVEDRGPGIAAEHIPHIFDRFWQAKHRRYGGVGLGLSIARGIVESHGGTLWVESEENRGSTFFFSVPYAASSAPAPDAPTRMLART